MYRVFCSTDEYIIVSLEKQMKQVIYISYSYKKYNNI